MRLKSVFISEYKNLKKFSINFPEDTFLEVFVGKNGSGKSNFFEALIAIFRHIYEFGPSSPYEVLFDYRISYEIAGAETLIEYSSATEVFTVDGKVRKNIGNTPIPDNILIYYAGQNTTVSETLNSYLTSFSSRIKSADISESRRFIGIGNDYKDLLLSIFLLSKDGNAPKSFVLNKLDVARQSDELKLVLTRPAYAKGSRSQDFNVENNDEEDRYWKAEGPVRAFLGQLERCSSPTPDHIIRTEGYLSDSDTYQLYLSVEKIKEAFREVSLLELFRYFDNLKSLEMLGSISIPLTLNSGVEASTSMFSDGQFQTIYIFAVSEIFKSANCITLLDEPDSFLHPEWQAECLKQVRSISAEAEQSNHVLMSSHSAVSLIQAPQDKIRYFDLKDGYAKLYPLPKRVAVEKLCSEIVRYSEQEQLLSIINTIQIENKPVLFTEGSTDPIILKEAWYKLYQEDIPFIPFYAFSCTYIKQLLTDNRIHDEMGGLPVFALFDFDKAFDQWNGLKGPVIQADVRTGMIKKWETGESYAFMLPIPDNDLISRQVMKEDGGHFGSDSLCEIEHLFYGAEGTADYFAEELRPGGGRFVIFTADDKKTQFSKGVVPGIDASYFEVLKPLFEFIKSKCVTQQAA